MFGSTLKALADPRPVSVKPPSMLSKSRPNGLPCFRASSCSMSMSFSVETDLLDSTMRFDCRDTGTYPASARPCPFDCAKRLERRAIEEERPQDALVDHRDTPRLDAFVVVEVVAHQLDVAELLQRRIEDDAQKRRQDRLADLLAERLCVVDVPLAVGLDAVAEDLVEEDAGRAAREDRRARERIDERRLPQPRRAVSIMLRASAISCFSSGKPGRRAGEVARRRAAAPSRRRPSSRPG